jgi:hypothetical protein
MRFYDHRPKDPKDPKDPKTQRPKDPKTQVYQYTGKMYCSRLNFIEFAIL